MAQVPRIGPREPDEWWRENCAGCAGLNPKWLDMTRTAGWGCRLSASMYGVLRNAYTLNRTVICFVSICKPTAFKIDLTVCHRISAGTRKVGSSSFIRFQMLVLEAL